MRLEKESRERVGAGQREITRRKPNNSREDGIE